LYGLKTILLAQGVMLLAVPAFAAEVSVGLDGDPQITASADETLKAADVSAAINAKLDAIKACFAEGQDAIDVSYKLTLDVSGTGMVTGVSAVENAPAQQACVDAAMKEVAMPSMSKPEATAQVTVTIKVSRSAEATEAKPAVEQTASVEKAVEQTAAAQQLQPGEQPKVAAAETVTAPLTTPSKEEDSKPWGVNASLAQSMGQGVFTDSHFASYAYSITLGGSYKIDPKYLSLSAKFAFSQELTSTYGSVGQDLRELFISDLGISASAPELYKDEQYTGVKVTAGVGLTFPFSKLSRDQERIMGSKISVGLSRSFENVGPGTVNVSWGGGLGYVFGPSSRTYDSAEWISKAHICTRNTDGSGECLTSLANPRWSLANTFTVSYDFLEKFSASYSFAIANSFASRLNDSTSRKLAAGVAFDPNNHSIHADPGLVNQVDATTSTLEVSYSVLDNLSVALGLTTAQSPFIQSGNNSSALRNPFWDFSSQADNLSSFYLDIAATY
jgi:hypothetical protein